MTVEKIRLRRNTSTKPVVHPETEMSQIIDMNVQRSTAYAVDDVRFESNLPSNMILVCTTAGTTAASAPATYSSATIDGTITDGTVVWTVKSRLGGGGGSGSIVELTQSQYNALSEEDKADSNKLYVISDAYSNSKMMDSMPIGTIVPFMGNGSLPVGYLLCDGSPVSRTMYPDLYRIIGITYGAGDNSTTFNLPNLLGRFIEGSNTAGLIKDAGLPNIEGAFAGVNTEYTYITGAFGQELNALTNQNGMGGSVQNRNKISFDASRCSSIYGNSDTVQPPSVTVRYMIKAFNAATPESSLVDITQYANDLANRLTREMTPAFNKRIEITTSGTFTAPVTGWYKFTIKGAGGGGSGGQAPNGSVCPSGSGGGEGGTTFAYEKMLVGETATITIGAGGTGGAASNGTGGTGGSSYININSNTYTATGGQGGDFSSIRGGGAGGTGNIIGIPGERAVCAYGGDAAGGSGGGAGGGTGINNTTGLSGTKGGGGAGGGTGGSTKGGDGGDGYVFIEYFDPTL